MKSNLLTIRAAYHQVVIKSSDSSNPFLEPFILKTGVHMYSVIRVLYMITKNHAISELHLYYFEKLFYIMITYIILSASTSFNFKRIYVIPFPFKKAFSK